MRRYTVIASVALAVFLLASAPAVLAQLEVFGIATYNTYNIGWDQILEADPEVLGIEDFAFTSGFGAFGGLRYWVREMVGVGAGLDFLRGSGSIDKTIAPGERATGDHSISPLGLGATAAVRVPVDGPIDAIAFGFIGSYGATYEVHMVGTREDHPYSGVTSQVVNDETANFDRKLGFLVGGSVGYELRPGLVIGAMVGHRWIEFGKGTTDWTYQYYEDGVLETYWTGKESFGEDDYPFDLSGLTAGLSISYTF